MSEINKYRKEYIESMRSYPRVLVYDLMEGEHKKAKLFFGEEIYKVRSHKYVNMTITENVYFWQYHLAKMVLSDCAYSYLKDYYEKNK